MKLRIAGKVVDGRLELDERDKLILRMGFADLSPSTARRLGLLVVEVTEDEDSVLRAHGCSWLLEGSEHKT
jgi:hypothetical protein